MLPKVSLGTARTSASERKSEAGPDRFATYGPEVVASDQALDSETRPPNRPAAAGASAGTDRRVGRPPQRVAFGILCANAIAETSFEYAVRFGHQSLK